MKKRVIAVLVVTLLTGCQTATSSPDDQIPPFTWTLSTGEKIERLMLKSQLIALLGEPDEINGAVGNHVSGRLQVSRAMTWTTDGKRPLIVFLNAGGEVVMVSDGPSLRD